MFVRTFYLFDKLYICTLITTRLFSTQKSPVRTGEEVYVSQQGEGYVVLQLDKTRDTVYEI